MADARQQKNAGRMVGMISLGCPKNLVDGETMLGLIQAAGLTVTTEWEQADVIVVNTCGFIQSAKEESIDAILEVAELKKKGQLKRLIVTGCLAQRYADELREALPEVDVFLGVSDLEEIVNSVWGRPTLPRFDPHAYLASADQPRLRSTPQHYAYLKIADGCDHRCGFCAIPLIRGAHRSRPMEDLWEEARRLVDQGVRELLLVSQDSSAYGRDLGLKCGLTSLLEGLVDIRGLDWIRIHYLFPHGLDPALWQLMDSEPKVCSYVDIPLQHVHATVLKNMGRGGNPDSMASLLDRIRSKVRGVHIRTSWIVGFPGEDDDAFEALCTFTRDQQLDHVGVFTYSLEEQTPAFGLGDPISQAVKNERRDTLLRIQRSISAEKLLRHVGTSLPVMVDGYHPETEFLLTGRHQGQAPEIDGEVLIREGDVSPGEIVSVKIEESYDYDLVGRVTGG